MPIRKFAPGEYYHCYNRGVEKRTTFLDKQDFSYFLKSMACYQLTETFEKLRLYTTDKLNSNKSERQVSILAYCINPNHFHLLLKEKRENGISKFMQGLCVSMSKHFNIKYEEKGSLFQGAFKSRTINDDYYLDLIHVYINTTPYNTALSW